jgi:excisionase family DNA binding protein
VAPSDIGDAYATMDDGAADRTPDTRQDTLGVVPLSASAAAALLGVNDRTIRRAIARGELPAVRHAGVYRIAPADLARYQEQRGIIIPPLPRPRSPLIGRAWLTPRPRALPWLHQASVFRPAQPA